MAGSWQHMTTGTGKPGNVEIFHGMPGTGGDVHEAAEECSGMVQWLASWLESITSVPRADWVSQVVTFHQEGLKLGGVQRLR